jgi:polyisoprenoid-binding protein YceI
MGRHPDASAPVPAASRERTADQDGAGVRLAPGWLSRLAGTSVALTRENTRVSFRIRWLGGLRVRGRFDDLTGTLIVPAGDPSQLSVCIRIRADSVHTGLALRDRHLRGARFLDASRYPLIVFRGGNVLRGDSSLEIPGSLTIRDVMHTLVLHCRSLPEPAVPGYPPDAPRAATDDGRARTDGLTLVAETSFNRAAFGIGAGRFGRLDPLMAAIGQSVDVGVEVWLR